MQLENYFKDPDVLTKIIWQAMDDIDRNRDDQDSLRKLEVLSELNSYAKQLVLKNTRPRC